MCTSNPARADDPYHPEGMVLAPPAAEQLRAAIDHADALLNGRDVDSGLRHLVAVLQCLRTLGQDLPG
jgi:hypothetical protein